MFLVRQFWHGDTSTIRYCTTLQLKLCLSPHNLAKLLCPLTEMPNLPARSEDHPMYVIYNGQVSFTGFFFSFFFQYDTGISEDSIRLVY